MRKKNSNSFFRFCLLKHLKIVLHTTTTDVAIAVFRMPLVSGYEYAVLDDWLPVKGTIDAKFFFHVHLHLYTQNHPAS